TPTIRLAALAALIPLAGCLGPAEFRGWKEPEYKFASCSGAPNGIAACHEQARAACPDGYQLAEERSDPEIQRYSIIVRCGAAAPPAVEEPTPPTRSRRAAPPAAMPPK
ncbi:MAG: hypothetical protein ACREIP_09055, partial [Alphaproteobacteria bacterium]